ncbi:MAG: class I SAM-dependent methyltransferase [Enhydrobacter sp.]|nr:MAG: class I SAM-dependent methyltransferase [Enhydrobacter sp.]
MDVETLRQELDKLSLMTNSEWLQSLNDRKLAELEFHNRVRDQRATLDEMPKDTYEKFYGNRKYYSATRRSNEYIRKWIDRHAPGRVFLDYACGNGGMARQAAHAGAKLVIGLDISDVSVANAKKAAAAEGLSNTYFVQADAENTRLPDGCVDAVMCSGMLHHLDLSYAFPELRRILKPGGRILAGEALDYNPLIKLYRLVTPSMRTEWEKAHILSLKDIAFARRFFEIGEMRFWHITGYVGGKFPALLPALDSLDRVLERIPLVQLMAWIFTFELIRPVAISASET